MKTNLKYQRLIFVIMNYKNFFTTNISNFTSKHFICSKVTSLIHLIPKNLQISFQPFNKIIYLLYYLYYILKYYLVYIPEHMTHRKSSTEIKTI